jgi:hypothetical protein
MSLPTSGTITMDMIRAELGVPTQSPFSLNTARSGGYVTLNPNSPTLPPATGQVSLASWYGYCQNCAAYYLSYASTSALACLNNDPITIISNTIPIGVGSILTDANGAQAGYPFYYSNGTNWYYADSNSFEQTIVLSTGSCGGPSYYEVQQCSGGSTYIMNATDVTPIVGGVYKVYAPTFIGTMNGINCWEVVSIQSSGLDDNATFGTNYGSCVACAASSTLFYISNSSLDISITDVKVNGISLTGATGAGFPVNSGDSINAYSNIQGTFNVDIYYSSGIYGQRIEGYDSNSTFYCNNTNIGSNVAQFGGASVGSGTFQIYAYDGGC